MSAQATVTSASVSRVAHFATVTLGFDDAGGPEHRQVL